MTDVHTRFTPEFLDSLKTATREQLESLGLCLWSSKTEKALWLFPGNFYDRLPVGYRVTDINFREAPFSRQTHDNETRYGILAFGVVHTYGCGLERPVCRCFDDASRDCGRHANAARDEGLLSSHYFDHFYPRRLCGSVRSGSLWSVAYP